MSKPLGKVLKQYIVNGRVIEGKSLNMQDVQLKEEMDGTYLFIVNGKSYHVDEVHLDLDKKTLRCKIDSKLYDLSLVTAFDQMIEGMGFEDASATEVNEVKAPMPGLVFDILIKVGQEVETDEPLMILEAMKMENIIKSPKSGKIKSIRVSKSASVEKNAVLIEFE